MKAFRYVGYVACIVGTAVITYLSISLGIIDKFDGIPGAMEEPAIALPTYLSFMSVMMTALTAVLAAVAIGIGVIAAYTFKEIKNEAMKAASEVANEVAGNKVDELLSPAVITSRIEKYAMSSGKPTDKRFGSEDTSKQH